MVPQWVKRKTEIPAAPAAFLFSTLVNYVMLQGISEDS